MPPRFAPARTTGAFLLLMALVTVGGCGGGGYHDVFVGTLEVHNSVESFEVIVDIEVSEVLGPYYVYFFDQDVFPGDSWFLDLFPTDYDVTLYWSDFLVESYRVSIFDDFTTTIFAFN